MPVTSLPLIPSSLSVTSNKSHLHVDMNYSPDDFTDHNMTPEEELMSLRFAQEEALTRQSVEDPFLQSFTWKEMPVDTAVAPFLSTPITPFQTTKRKKAHTSAVYYSECFLKGVTPNDADTAALDIEERYNKWWVEAGFQNKNGEVGTGSDNREPDLSAANSSFALSSVADTAAGSVSAKRPHATHSSQQNSVGIKRVRRRGGLRDVIQDHTVNPHEATLPDCTASSASIPESASSDNSSIHIVTPSLSNVSQELIMALRDEMVEELKASGGDTDNTSFKSKLETLHSFYISTHKDARAIHGNSSDSDLDGTWLTLSKPTYRDVKGRNAVGQYMYLLGGMSFDMFRPTGLLCSIQGIFNTVHAINPATNELPAFIPRSLRKEVRQSLSHHEANSLRTYK
jgi:hypothetical protein